MTVFVDMAHTPKEMVKEASPSYQQSIYPYGLCLRLGTDELEKLDIEDDFKVGDIIDLRCFAKVTSVSMNQMADSTSRCMELQITHLAVENENNEDEDEEAGESTVVSKLGRRNPYK